VVKRLIIAEKPSVAKDIAHTLAVPFGGKGYFESEQWIVSSALGHLFEITLPPSLASCIKWNLKDLPLLPEYFALSPLSHAKQQLSVLLGLLKRTDVDSVINACDAGREGELIFAYIMRYAKCSKPVERLWLQSMTPAAIKDSFTKLRPGAAMKNLGDAAVSRAESDWLVGINGTRALTLTSTSLSPVGRVQTPTLALVVARDMEIQQFVPKDYWLVKATFQAKASSYEGTWFDPGFKGERPERIWEQIKAGQIKTRCLRKPGTVTDQSKQVSRSCPALFDLTSLQREANKRLGYSAAKTLKLAQELYETHKVLTYPRTDARVLPDDYVPVAIKTMEMVAANYAPFQGFAKKVLENTWIKPDKRIFNSAKVTDHFAIIPTGKPPEGLPAEDAALYRLVVQRFVAIFYPAAEYFDTERITKVEQDCFKSRGRVVINPGWTVVYGTEAEEGSDKKEDDAQALPPIGPTETPLAEPIHVLAEKTKPPPRYNDATLLSAMESAGKVISEEELREAMSERGLGTPATRAATIESLINSAYLERKRKDLLATAKGVALIARLHSLALDSLCSPQLTGEWEYKLRQMEQGHVQRGSFMQEIAAGVVMIVAKVKGAAPKAQPVAGLACPKCKKGLVTPGGEALMCPDGHVAFKRVVAKRPLSDEEIKRLLSHGLVGPLSGFVSKSGKNFSALLKLDEKGAIAFDFGEKEEPTEFIDHAGWNIGIGNRSYVAKKGSQQVLIHRLICQRPFVLDEVKDLLETGKTSLLAGFISKAGKPFSAFLVLKSGKVEFEFPPRSW
jgi:DNA topoisomerase III